MDFTLKTYADILDAAATGGYRMCAVADWFDGGNGGAAPTLVLRHDVDRRPKSALAMAEMEAGMGVRGSYYFRIVPTSFVPEIVGKISALGHEIGYHYEDWDRARGDAARAITLFTEALASLRAIAPVTTICMHGSPLARENNMTIWEHHAFATHGVRDCVLSDRWQGFAYFTDAGRTFGPTSANLRDALGDAECPPGVRSSAELAAFLRARKMDRIMLSTHPERWSDAPTVWVRQWAWDAAANLAKRGLRRLRDGAAR